MQVDDTLKELYKSDLLEKNLFLEFYRPGEDDPFLILGGEQHILGGSMKITEALSSSENLDFGSCEATQLEITVIDVDTDIIGSTMRVYQVLQGSLFPAEELYPSEDLYPAGYVMPLGTYIVQSAPRQTNGRYRDVLALDKMSLFDVNVIDWYNSLKFPMTLKDFRASLCKHIGVDQEVPNDLPNDDMLVEKTIDTTELIGRDVLIACEQINGVFGHFDRNGVLQHVSVEPNLFLFPAEDLYPSTDLYPGETTEESAALVGTVLDTYLCISCRLEEYTVMSIDTVHIRQEEGDIGAIYGKGNNCYIVEGNFLVYGKTAAELNKIAAGIHGMISGIQYIPFEYSGKGLPYVSVGDMVWLQKEGVATYVMKRTLTGTYALKDEYGATGEETRSTENNMNTEIIQLKGRSAVLKKSIEEVSVTITDLEAATQAQFKVTSREISAEVKRAKEEEGELSSKITQTAEQITIEVTRAKEAEETMSSKITQNAEAIELKVSKGDVSSQISVESGQVTFKSNRLIVDSTNFKLDSSGNVAISGNATISGKISASTISGSEISGSEITGTTIETDTFYAGDDEVWIGDYKVSADSTGTIESLDGSILISTAAAPGGVQFKIGGVNYTSNAFGVTGTITATDTVYGKCFQGTKNYYSKMYDLKFTKSWWNGWSVTQTVHKLWEMVLELAMIIDDQWGDYTGVYNALAEWNDNNQDEKDW